jgi:putative transposase
MLKRSSHSVWDCRYHVVWATKRRKKALTEPHEREHCEKLLRRIAEEYDMVIQELEVDQDHVHLYIEIPPQLSVGQGVRVLKSVSAREMFKRFGYLHKVFWSGQMWSPSYFVRTVGDGVTAEMVSKYIKNHEQKTKLGSVQAELFPKSTGSRKLPERRT